MLLIIIINHVSGIRLRDCSELAVNLKRWSLFDVIVFFFLRLESGLSFMILSVLVLELWQYLLKQIWPKIWELQTPRPKSCTTFWNWKELGISKLPWVFPMSSYYMLVVTWLLLTFLSYLRIANKSGKLGLPSYAD